MTSSSVVADGADVIVAFNETNYKFIQAKKGKTLFLKNGIKLQLGELIGREYGSYFDVSGGKLKALTVSEMADVFQLFGLERNADEADNRDMAQDGSAQTLDADSIKQLKSTGTDGRDIVGELVTNSKTFASRTAFSQQKYLVKKKRKYVPTIQLLRPTARTIAHAFYVAEPKTTSFLRIDALASLIYAANIQADSLPVVVGDTGGLVCGAIFERLSAQGRILFLRCKDGRVAFPALKYFGKDLRNRIDVHALGSDAAREWCASRGGATSLIVVGNFDPRETLFASLPLLLPSANFAVHCRFAEPLSDCYFRLLRGAMACNLQLSSSFHRVHQILPNRTHPNMQMDGASGFTLTGTTVVGGFDPDAVNDELDRKKAAAAAVAAAAAAAASSTATTAETAATAEGAASTATEVETDAANAPTASSAVVFESSAADSNVLDNDDDEPPQKRSRVADDAPETDVAEE